MQTDGFPGKIMAVDWGEKRIGLAISDETRTLARGLDVIPSRSRRENAERIIKIARENSVSLIIVGVTYENAGNLTPSGRRAERLARVIGVSPDLEVRLIDESRSTQEAKEYQIEMGTNRKDRRGHLDDKAAAVILQAFLEKERIDG